MIRLTPAGKRAAARLASEHRAKCAKPEIAGSEPRGELGPRLLAENGPALLFVKSGARVMTVATIRANRKSERLRGKNHSYREGDTH